ncbi:MAG: MSHA biogenesis protein MshN, partial [Gammaproteobacteria bacterium]|nr:MSHA biogenesis protein MshN [Gammaproteobacteria bacterium]
SDIPIVSEAPEYHELLAYVAQQLKKDRVAIKHYQMLLQQNANRADWWLGVAVSEDRLGNNQPALQAYQQAIDKPGLSFTVQAYARKRIKALQGF